MKKQHFGTDGIRGRVGEEPITPEFMLKLGWAAGRVLSRQGKGQVLIGKDTRISGYMFESALQAGLSAAGVDILLLGPMPTPAIAYLTRTFHAQAGIVISASHNLYYDNGIKFFSDQGSKLSDEIELAIEAQLLKPMVTVESSQLGKAKRVEDAGGRYIEFCKSTIPLQMMLRGMRIVVDAAHGATYHVAPNVFRELGAEVLTVGDAPDGLNINAGVGSTHPQFLQSQVLHYRADLGIALDGDGDRVMMVDHTGEVLDGDELLYIIARSRKNQNTLKGAVVGTVMSNLGLEHALRDQGVDFKRAAVGDRYVLEMLRQENCVLGGESSGHIICLDKTTTGDGTVSALQVLAAVVHSGSTLHQLKSGMKKYPQVLINVKMDKKFDVANHEQIRKAVRDAEVRLADTGRVLLRPSGTEPLVRVMVEGQDQQKVQALAQEIASAVTQAMKLA